ncbi:MAG: hypothetical protein ACNS61_09790, partial [Candidatus Wenzhouxiangella sp. M2_3B_020]
MIRWFHRSCLPIALALAAADGLAQPAAEAARQYRQAHESEILHSFAEFLEIPNVADDTADIRRNARHIRREFAERGIALDIVGIDDAPPIVTGRIPVPGATRTLGIYVHYDGQPVDETRWTHGPWTPTLYTGAMDAGGEPRALPETGERIDPEARLYARAAGDDKAPIIALLTALDALAARDLSPTSNIVLLFDGE